MHANTIHITINHHHHAAALADAQATAREAAQAAAAAVAVSLTPPAPGELWAGQGGHYVCTLPALQNLPARHLIVSAEEATGLAFGPRDFDVPDAACHLNGAANTAALLASGKEHPAARWAANHTCDGHSDFFLPSRADLFMAWLAAPQLFNTAGWYWSSSQCSRYDAWAQDFEYGLSDFSGEDDEFRVRAVRVIQLQPFIA